MTIDWTETDVLTFHNSRETTVEPNVKVTPSIKIAYKETAHTALIYILGIMFPAKWRLSCFLLRILFFQITFATSLNCRKRSIFVVVTK